LNDLAGWLEIPITFRAKCYECGKEILPGPAFWSDSKKSAKHLKCGKSKSQIEGKTLLDNKPTIVPNGKNFRNFKNSYENIELKCFVCGKAAGCPTCTFSSICDRRIVSQQCICEACLNVKSEKEDAFKRYQQVFIQKYLHRKK
jgi:hypothetical protein